MFHFFEFFLILLFHNLLHFLFIFLMFTVTIYEESNEFVLMMPIFKVMFVLSSCQLEELLHLSLYAGEFLLVAVV